jgi:S-(hydroxymethyl)glutathione dehydrogenase/alcohol dehydrogenase
VKTNAAILYEINKPLIVDEVEIPPLKKGQVIVELAYSGICRSQMGEWMGFRGPDPYLPHLLGHEGSGIVCDIHPSVTKIKPGDHVVLSWMCGKGIEAGGTSYGWRNKTVSAGGVTTFIEKAVISENRITPIPNNFSLKVAALMGCAGLTGVGMVKRVAKVSAGRTVCIIGLGGVGLCALAASIALKAEKIIAVDRHTHKLQRAVDFGAHHAISTKEVNLTQYVMDITMGEGADYVFETAGTVNAIHDAFNITRSKGGLCVICGNPPIKARLKIDPYELMKGKTITGTSGGECIPDEDIPYLIELYQSKQLKLDDIITDIFRLESINDAFELHLNGHVGRGVIDLRKA